MQQSNRSFEDSVKPGRHQPDRLHQKGVGLIEILVAIVLLSIGFLAAAQMQMQGMRFSQSAYNHSQAYFMASDMIDRMRNNIRGVKSGHYTGAETKSTATNPQCGTTVCNEQQIANQDIHDWSSRLYPLNQAVDASNQPVGTFVAALPSSTAIPAKGAILSLGNGVFTVRVIWSEVENGTATQQTLDVNFATENF